MTIKINKNIPLPKNLQKSWQGTEAVVYGDKDTLVVKRIRQTSSDLRARLQEVGKGITQEDIKKAIQVARK